MSGTANTPLSRSISVVSLFAIIHVPRVYHAALFSQIFSWLRPGTGVALLGLGGNDNAAQQETWHGVRMAWSHFDAATSLRMLRDAGFEVLGSEEEQCGGPGDPTETHLFAHVPVATLVAHASG